MSKVTKAVIAAMFAGGDGVTVGQEGANLQVAFSFSNNLVNKIKTVPDAKFDKDAGVWNVPEASVDKLIEAVADMRDFVRNNGVQVKDVEGGGKQVLFDYNKQMTQVIGAVNGAEFDGQVRVWNVPAGSKALVVPEGQSTSYLDMAVNKMRGIGIDFVKDRDSIIDLAAATPKLQGSKIAPCYPAAGQSYSGEMVSVNGNFAAQLTNIKDGSAFVVIHSLSDIGDVFKGQDFRVDYDANRHADVRSADLFKKQQTERESLTATAAGLVDGANTINASIKDGGKYSGVVMDMTDNMVLLSGGRKEFTVHRRDVMGGAELRKGQNLEVSYKGGKSMAVDTDRKKEAAVAR